MCTVLDNGAYTLKVGGSTDDRPLVIPNSVSRYAFNRRTR